MNPITTQPNQPTEPNQLDPQVVNLAKAIRNTESGGDFTAKGKSGEYGAYQFTPETWKADSTKYGINAELEQATPQQQNEVAYKKLVDLKSKGYNVGQIASIWNSGKPEWEGNVGTNKFGVHYDTPKYVDSVAKTYQAYKAGVNPQITPTTSTVNQKQPDPTLGQELGQRVKDAGSAISNTISGKINPISGVLQTAGAVAGGLGDIVGKGLELIPGVKWIEGKIGQGIGDLAKTQAGQSVLKSMQEFAQKHPELSADIGAGFNIATAIPIFRGLGVVKDIALTGVSKSLKEIAEKGIVRDLGEAMTRTKTLTRSFEKNGGEKTIREAIKHRIVPDIENGRFNSKEALAQTGDAISAIEDGELTPALAEISRRQNFGQSLNTLKNKAILAAENDQTLREAGMVPQAVAQIEKRFAGWQHSFGDTIDLTTQNRLKIGTGKFTEWGTPEGSADKSIYHALQHDIEEVARRNGFKNVDEINKRMANLIKYQSMLNSIDGTPVKSGLTRGLVQKGLSMAGGAALGSMTGGGIANELLGGLVGERMSGLAGKKAVGGLFRSSILKKSGPEASRSAIKGVKKIPGLVTGTALQKANNQHHR